MITNLKPQLLFYYEHKEESHNVEGEMTSGICEDIVMIRSENDRIRSPLGTLRLRQTPTKTRPKPVSSLEDLIHVDPHFQIEESLLYELATGHPSFFPSQKCESGARPYPEIPETSINNHINSDAYSLDLSPSHLLNQPSQPDNSSQRGDQQLLEHFHFYHLQVDNDPGKMYMFAHYPKTPYDYANELMENKDKLLRPKIPPPPPPQLQMFPQNLKMRAPMPFKEVEVIYQSSHDTVSLLSHHDIRVPARLRNVFDPPINVNIHRDSHEFKREKCLKIGKKEGEKRKRINFEKSLVTGTVLLLYCYCNIIDCFSNYLLLHFLFF